MENLLDILNDCPVSEMTSSPTFQILCCELIEDHYGEFYRSIFESLVSGGRLTAPQVAQKCHLPLRQARAGLASLLQLRLINHYSTKDAPTTYSPNLNSAYEILRVGRLIELVSAKHGEAAGKMMSLACNLGFATFSELRDRAIRDGIHNPSGHIPNLERLIQDLVDDHFLIMQRRIHVQEAHDAKRQIEQNFASPAALAKLTGTKAKAEHHAAVESRYRHAADTTYPEHGRTNPSYMLHGNISSVTQLNGTSTNGHGAVTSALLQPNYHRVVISSQVNRVNDAVTKMYGTRAASVLSAAVQQVANPDGWPIHDIDGIRQLNMDKLQLDASELIHACSPSILSNGTSRTNGNFPEDYGDKDNVHIQDLERELSLLREGSLHFIRHTSSSWEMDKDILDAWTRQEEILCVMTSRIDAPGPRILRILIDKGKLEEKTLQELGLLGAKELRQSLSKLKQMGYLELQEIPRDPHRLPNKTVFLWHHDTVRVARVVMEAVYASMLHLLQMLKLERNALAGTLEKIGREDVKGKEREMLAPGEYVMLERFRRLESWAWAELHRMDSTVAILRDL